MNDVDIVGHFTEQNLVAAEFLKGKDERTIAKELDLPRTRVQKHIREWKDMASHSEAVRSRAREALAGADLHYNGLIKDTYKLIADAEEAFENDDVSRNQSLTLRAGAIKMVADLESKRIDMLQKAGLLENQELADQLVEQEKRMETIMNVITNVIGKCDHCRNRVLHALSELDGPVVIPSEAV